MKQLVTTAPVEIALKSLDADSVRKVHGWFDHLSNWDSDPFVRSRSHELDEIPEVYVLKTSNDLRIFFRLDGNTITVLDVAKRSTILTSGHTADQE